MVHMRLDVAVLVEAVSPPTAPPSRREPVFITPPPPSRLFTGRAEVLKKMYDAFFSGANSTVVEEQRCYVLHGLGGSGKTQLALKFIKDHRSRCVNTVCREKK